MLFRIILSLAIVGTLYYLNPLSNNSSSVNETNKQSIDSMVKDVVNTVDNAKAREQQALKEVEEEHLK